MSANRVWIWGLLLAAVGTVLWYRSQVMPAPQLETMQTTRVIFVTGGSDDFWQLTVKGAEAASREYNAELKVEMPSHGEGLAQQQHILVGLNAEEIDGVALSPLDAEGQTRLINLLAKKTNVVTFDSDAPLSERQCYVGTSNYRAGQICNDLVSEAIPEGGKIAVFLSNLTKNNMVERKAGYEENEAKLSASAKEEDVSPSWQTVEYMIDEGNLEKTEENILQALKKHRNLACLVGMNGYHGPILLKVLREAGQLGKIKLVVFDEANETLDGISSGDIYATVVQDPYMYGYEAVRMLTSLHNGKSRELPIVGGSSFNVNCQPIRQSNLEEFKQRLQERLGETDAT
ncbi:MAG: substrate-binding domain-containing protein [Pirellulales bacterium]|nr:substrate-binding domain-containing protein [Pirellulales bacterium]